MAGGMGRKQDWGSIADRTASAREPEETPALGPAPPPIKPCWVTDRHGRLPGLLLEWRRVDSGYQGRVVRPVLDADGWIVVSEWLPSELLEPGAFA